LRVLVATTLLLASSCALSSDPSERAGRVSLPLLGGRISGDDEDANVLIETKLANFEVTHCSGRLVTPRLLLSARHCFLKAKSRGLHCNADGSSEDLSTDVDLHPEPVEQVTVFVGARRGSQRQVQVQEIVSQLEASVCISDIVFLVLKEPVLEVRTPIRRAQVRVGEEFSVTGWGYTSEENKGKKVLPSERWTRDRTKVTEVGPGLIPPGTFASSGNSLCLGDSGSVALIDGALAGVYSRIDGAEAPCSNEFTRNVLQGFTTQTQLIKAAFAAVGETPLYDDEVDAGAPAQPDAGPAPTTPRADDGSCAMTRGASFWTSPLPLAFALLLARRRRRD
jgi:hypothetical protein